MNSKITFFLLLLSSFIFLNATCNNVIPKEPIKDTVVKCIDKTKIDPNKGCPKILNPVCGCDGKTYPNACEAEKAGVINTSKGECPCIDESKINPKQPCTREYKPVCGCNDKTYGNACEAKKAGVTKWRDGKCKDDCIDKSNVTKLDCPDEYAPVCGCDGKTYSNDCVARAAGVQRWDKGKCPDNSICIDTDQIDDSIVCGRIYKPVCGCNNVTYPNKCEAEKNGVTKWKEGKCKE